MLDNSGTNISNQSYNNPDVTRLGYFEGKILLHQ